MNQIIEKIEIRHTKGNVSKITPELTIELFEVKCHFYKYFGKTQKGRLYFSNFYIGCANNINFKMNSTIGSFEKYSDCKNIALAVDKAKAIIVGFGVYNFQRITGIK